MNVNKSRTLAIRLSDNRFLEVTKMSIFDRLDYLDLLKRLYTYLNNYPKHDISDLYVNHAEFRHLANSCLALSGIDGHKLSIELLTGLLFSCEEYPHGLLNQFNFEFGDYPSSEGVDTKGSLLCKIYKAIGDIDQAMTLAKNTPYDVLEDFLKELKPREEKSKDDALEYIKKHGVPLPTKKA